MTKSLCIVLCLIAAPAAAQVEVSVRTEKPSFLVGEPIFVLVDVKNVGDEPVAYGGGGGRGRRLELSVASGDRRRVQRLSGCFGGESGGTVGGVMGHPPLLKPGASTTFRYLLRGYRLRPGTYEFRVSGTADVGWKYYPQMRPNAPPPPVPKHMETDPVEGADVDRTLPLVIAGGSQTELEAAWPPYVAIAPESYTQKGNDAASALLEMAPPFLEQEIVKLARARGHEYGIADRAAAALGEINTTSSRAELVAWFDRSRDLVVRSAIVDAIARTGHRDNLVFLASLLPGRSAEADDRIRRTAALGIGLMGGDAAVDALRRAPEGSNPLVESAVLEALGNTKSRSAVPVIIDRAKGTDGYVRNGVCGALITLTHRSWCGGSADLSAEQTRWRRWWSANGPTAPIYGPEECPTANQHPEIR